MHAKWHKNLIHKQLLPTKLERKHFQFLDSLTNMSHRCNAQDPASVSRIEQVAATAPRSVVHAFLLEMPWPK